MDPRTFALDRPVLRFAAISLVSSAIDNVLFYILFRLTGRIGEAQAGARLVSTLFNYMAVRNMVFRCEKPHGELLPRYLFLVTLNALLSYGGILLISTNTRIPVPFAKMIAETILFLLNYLAQKAYVFAHSGQHPLP